MKLISILRGVKVRPSQKIGSIDVKGLSDDSRCVKRGYLYVAVKGRRFDGHDFLEEAIRRGARAVAADRDFCLSGKGAVKILVDDARSALPAIAANFYGHPSGELRIIGVTGTNGKTTITYLLEEILRSGGLKAGVIGTINHRIGGRTIESKNTTPGPLELQKLLRDMADSRLDFAVMEVSSHSLDQERIAGIRFDSAIFTNITREHLDYHRTLRKYLKAKSEIFKYLKKGGAAILNADDPRVVALRRSIKGAVLTYGITHKADVMAKDISESLDCSAFTARTPQGDIKVRAGLLGRHNISNMLAAIAAAISVGVGPKAIKDGIGNLRLVPGRLENAARGAPFTVFVDYAHTDDALRNVLKLLRRMRKRDIITVFGCGGDRDKSKRPRMGHAACALSDKVVVTSDNPRTEKPADIIEDIVSGIRGSFFNFSVEPDRAKAIEKAVRMARPGDIVLIAGKGHEKCQIRGDKTVPFDDCEVVRRIIAHLSRKQE